MSTIRDLRQAWPLHRDAAQAAFTLFRSYCSQPMPRVPGMDTAARMALRFFYGRAASIEECAAREYIYRWHLAIKAPDQCIGGSMLDPCVSIFGAPHPIGL
jgi:hypothetical protein